MTGQNLYRAARKRIPGGVQLLSKRPEMFLPDHWPSYYREARGAEVWDLDCNRYIDMSYSAVGACSLGYADPDVEAAVLNVVRRGSMCTLNAPEEVALADLLCEIHPWADMVRYARCGGEGMSVAVRIARARTRKDKIVFCGYHGWTDWYLAANLAEDTALDGHLLPGLAPAGVPRGLAGTAIPFRYNDLPSFHQALQQAGPDLAAVVMEPLRSNHPDPGFLESIREETRRRNALLVFDEVTAAWRLNSGGVHLLGNVTPDIAVLAKALSNGYPMAAIIGAGDAMQAAQDTFVSSTYWTERIGPTAALATIQKHRKVDVSKHLIAMGERVQNFWRNAAQQTGLDISVAGIAPLSRFTLDVPNAQAVRTLFTQMMLDRGYLASNAFYAMYAHTPEQVDSYGAAVTEVFAALHQAIDTGTVESQLRGPVAHTGFARLA
ncbi:MAG: aminotransferase class III-fold pyridoxal phosphate-dependent enzyme [Bryobacterales bacterium]|nr:aminotransferase class III-fold pyridoxal phosphate-dependent enzyme [Bryobacterales bacterium]